MASIDERDDNVMDEEDDVKKHKNDLHRHYVHSLNRAAANLLILAGRRRPKVPRSKEPWEVSTECCLKVFPSMLLIQGVPQQK